jgi:hypothetical protein
MMEGFERFCHLQSSLTQNIDKTMTADIGIILGARAICSLIGLVIIFVGFWIKERRWDDQGTVAYDKYKSTVDEDYHAVDDEAGNNPNPSDDVSQTYNSVTEKFNFHDNGSRDVIQMNSSDAEDRFPLPRSLQREIEAALPIPIVMLLGFALWMISFIFSPQAGNEAYNSGWNIASIFFVAAIAATYVAGLRKATLERNMGLKKKFYLAVLFFTIWLGIAGLADSEIDAPWYFCTLAGKLAFLLLATTSSRHVHFSRLTLTYADSLQSSFYLLQFTFFAILERWVLLGTSMANQTEKQYLTMECGTCW